MILRAGKKGTTTDLLRSRGRASEEVKRNAPENIPREGNE